MTPMPEPRLDERAVEAAAAELECEEGSWPYVDTEEARIGWARSIIAAYFAALDREALVARASQGLCCDRTADLLRRNAAVRHGGADVSLECVECGSRGPKWSHLIERDDDEWVCKHRRACEARQMLTAGASSADAAAHAQRLKVPDPEQER